MTDRGELLEKYFYYASIRRLVLLILLGLWSLQSTAQKYTFLHFDTGDGLIESQVNYLASDSLHRLWIATNGGAALFDGKEFVSYTRQNGMPTNFVNAVMVDKAGTAWFATQNGLAKMAGNKLVDCTNRITNPVKRVHFVTQAADKTIWFTLNYRLYKVSCHGAASQMAGDTITCIAANKLGTLYCSVYHKGIYCLRGGQWVNIASFDWHYPGIIVTGITFDRDDPAGIYLLSGNNILSVKDNKIYPLNNRHLALKGPFYSFCKDNNNNFWIGTDSGAYCLSGTKLTHFTSRNGFTDNPVTFIYNDPDNNLWLATQGNGLFKYEGGRVLLFDKSQGLRDGEIVMCVTGDDRGRTLFGVYDAGIMQYDGRSVSAFRLTRNNNGLRRVQCLYTDKAGKVWIGTDRAGLWTCGDGRSFRLVSGSTSLSVNAVAEDAQGVMLISTATGCFFLNNGSLRRLNGFYSFAHSMTPISRDSILIGTQDGVLLAVKGNIVQAFRLSAVAASAIFSVHKYGHTVFLGTDDRGIFAWDLSTDHMANFTARDGLNSNTIYSMVHDDNGVIWVGTGRGVNRLVPQPAKGTFTIENATDAKNEMLESNENAIYYAANKVWVGTTKGLVVYDDRGTALTVRPHITIQSVELVSQAPDSYRHHADLLKNGTRLAYNNNHISITFLGINLSRPENVKYSYKLKGIDSVFSQPVKNNTVDYPSLPPGDYTFQVKAMDEGMASSSNVVGFSFIILPPFYQTVEFKVLGILFFILVGVLIQAYRHRLKINRAMIIEEAKERESLRIRQQTAADFHDELGNQLTRITVLSEILGTKIGPGQVEQKKLLEQIKLSAGALYSGTREILWALNPKSDNLYEVLNHMRAFGSELFMDTAVDFEFDDFNEPLKKVRMPIECSRNLPAIFKELFNNVLKHANATAVSVRINYIEKDEIKLTMRDNGRGFDLNREREGQGINNIMNRAKRIGAVIKIDSKKDIGTTVKLIIRIAK